MNTRKPPPTKPWWYPLIVQIDEYLHAYICPLVVKYADEPYDTTTTTEKENQ